MANWNIAFYANEYEEYHLAPDEWEVNCSEDELNGWILRRIADRLGVTVDRVSFNPADDEIILLDGEKRGSIIVS